MRGLNVMYDFVRRPSMAFDPTIMAMQRQQQIDPTSPSLSIPPPTESPMTPLPENLQNYEIDDEFNLPISVAIVMLLTYMFFGAAIYCTWEDDWTFFESFYFVFISISTIGEQVEWKRPEFNFPISLFNLHRFRFRWFCPRSSHLHDGFDHLSDFWTRSHIHGH